MTLPIKSPCIKVCAVDGQTGFCLGCGRKMPEIVQWAKYSDPERDGIMAELPDRKAKLKSLGKLG